MDIKLVASNMLTILGTMSPSDNTEAVEGRSDIDHLVYMCESMLNEEVVGEKAHRWLGWVQACLYISGDATLEELKAINKNA